jgi:hypothetical protein
MAIKDMGNKDHGTLSGLQGGITREYYRVTDHKDLTGLQGC